MTTVTLEQVKQSLRQTHDSDDDLLTRLIESAERECLNYMALESIPEVNGAPSPDVINGIILIVQADYDGDPLNREKLKIAAHALWDYHATQDRFSL